MSEHYQSKMEPSFKPTYNRLAKATELPFYRCRNSSYEGWKFRNWSNEKAINTRTHLTRTLGNGVRCPIISLWQNSSPKGLVWSVCTSSGRMEILLYSIGGTLTVVSLLVGNEGLEMIYISWVSVRRHRWWNAEKILHVWNPEDGHISFRISSA